MRAYQSNPELLRILISLNGSKKEIHELSRDNFELTYNAAQQLGIRDVKYGINWVARHDNVRDLENLIWIAKDLVPFQFRPKNKFWIFLMLFYHNIRH